MDVHIYDYQLELMFYLLYTICDEKSPKNYNQRQKLIKPIFYSQGPFWDTIKQKYVSDI